MTGESPLPVITSEKHMSEDKLKKYPNISFQSLNMGKIITKIKKAHTPNEKALSEFEVFCLRFPITSGNIFKIIDDESLAHCKGISRTVEKLRKDSTGSGLFRDIGIT